MSNIKKKLPPEMQQKLLDLLHERFQNNPQRHNAIEWPAVESKLIVDSEKLWSLNEMENTGGEPDVIGKDPGKDEYLFVDCAAESPEGRRTLCYDQDGLNARKDHKPQNNACDRQP